MRIILCTKENQENFLMHYRLGGEKKGVRRWQNKDGSYTPAGYKHYAEMYGWGKKRRKNQEDETKKSEHREIKERKGNDADRSTTESKSWKRHMDPLKDLDNFNHLSKADQQKVGDAVLRRLGEYSDAFNSGYLPRDNKDFYDELNKYQNFLMDRVYDKSGSINAGDYKRGSNAAKANEKADATWSKLDERRSQIEREIGYKGRGIQNSKEYKKEAERLRKALEKDDAWKKLDAQWNQDFDDVLGAILTDIGFSDTPKNRSLLYMYGWFD